MFSGLSISELSVLDSEQAVIDIEDGSKFEGHLKVSYSSGHPSIHFLASNTPSLFLVPFNLEDNFGQNLSPASLKLRLFDLRGAVNLISSTKKTLPLIFEVNFP